MYTEISNYNRPVNFSHNYLGIWIVFIKNKIVETQLSKHSENFDGVF